MKNSKQADRLVTLSTADLKDHSMTQCRFAAMIAATINMIGVTHPRVLARYASKTLSDMTTDNVNNPCAAQLLKVAILRGTSHTYTGEYHTKNSIDHKPGQLSLISSLN